MLAGGAGWGELYCSMKQGWESLTISRATFPGLSVSVTAQRQESAKHQQRQWRIKDKDSSFLLGPGGRGEDASKWSLYFYLLKDPLVRDQPQTSHFPHPKTEGSAVNLACHGEGNAKAHWWPQEEPKPFQERSPCNMVRCSLFGE